MKEEKLRARGERKQGKARGGSRVMRGGKGGKLCLAEDSKEDFDIASQRTGCLEAYFVCRCINTLSPGGTEGLEVQTQPAGCAWTECAVS